MSELKTILVHVDEAGHCPNRLALAAALAKAHGAQLIGVHVVPPLFIPAYMPGDASPGLIDVIEAQRKSAQAKAEAHFSGLKRDLPSAIWRVVDADVAGPSSNIIPALASEVRQADLAIVGQAGPGEEDSDTPGLVPEELVMRAGRPVLVVPYAGRFAGVGERAVVAWTDTREAARAMSDALPLLKLAKSVTVMQIGDKGADQEARRAALTGVAGYLERHGVKAAAEFVPGGGDVAPADLLLSRVADLAADLLVMGGYGHSRFRELVLGGVTREILSSMTIPVLLSH
jgi:nucleotide-binding universal stress UspA family protein